MHKGMPEYSKQPVIQNTDSELDSQDAKET